MTQPINLERLDNDASRLRVAALIMKERNNFVGAELISEEARAIEENIRCALEEAKLDAIPDPDLTGTLPALQTMTVLGVDLTIVNWLDYKGWEVRRRAEFNGDNTLLGWVNWSDSSERSHSVRAVAPNSEAHFSTFGRALAFLIAEAELS